LCALPIGELSRLTGTPAPTIRYYEDIGLLPKAARGKGNQRRYGPADHQRLHFIRTRRALGFSLKDIARLLAESADCAPSLSLAQQQLARVQKQIAALMAVAADLQAQIAACETDCASGASATCLIIPV
jgi:DNA-binding transcriptional MerR regulator